MQPSRADPKANLRNTRANPWIDKRSTPSDGWAIGKWFRRSPAAAGLAAYFDMSNVAGDQTFGQLSPAAINNLAAPEWPPELAEPVTRKGKLVGMIIHPVDYPVIGPVPIELPMPDLNPVLDPIPIGRPQPAPRPVSLPRPRPRSVLAGPPASRPKTQSEITLVIERVPSSSGQPAIRVRSVQRFKYQIYASRPRRIDGKGIYLRLQQFITATFGTVTELQDFVEAAAWNIVDAKGRPVMTQLRGNALDRSENIENAFTRGALVNFSMYASAFDGLIDGRYSLDLGGFAFDYAMSQASDVEAAWRSKTLETWGRSLGLDTLQGVDAMMSMHRRISGMPKAERESLVRTIHQRFRSSFARRVYWSRSRSVYER